MEGSISREQGLTQLERDRGAGEPDSPETTGAQRAKFSTQIGPVITSTHAEQLADENAEDYKRAQESYEHMDWAPTPEA